MTTHPNAAKTTQTHDFCARVMREFKRGLFRHQYVTVGEELLFVDNPDTKKPLLVIHTAHESLHSTNIPFHTISSHHLTTHL